MISQIHHNQITTCQDRFAAEAFAPHVIVEQSMTLSDVQSDGHTWPPPGSEASTMVNYLSFVMSDGGTWPPQPSGD